MASKSEKRGDDDSPTKLDLNKIQQEMNNLVERRMEFRRRMDNLRSKKEEAVSAIKSAQKELDGIDGLFQDKLDELNKYRG